MSAQESDIRMESPQAGLEMFYYDDKLLAVLLTKEYSAPGISFFTPGAFSQQLGYMNWPKNHIILPHDHNPVQRQVEWTQETLIIRKGMARLDFYAPGSRDFLGSRILCAGDIILLANGGHGFEILEDGEIVEVKQGPYADDMDKTRFQPHDGPMAGKNAER